MAAGAGYIEFTTGDILTASAANSYLASQVVMVFASASARTSAIASPQEGMISYLKDTNAVEYYSGSAWAAVGGGGGGGGKVLQVVSATYATNTTSTSSTYADTGLTATITPSASTSKVLVLVHQSGLQKFGATSMAVKLLRAGTTISTFGSAIGYNNSSQDNSMATASASYLDSPATTSATIYKTQFSNLDATGTVACQGNSSMSTITLLEIGA